eukprot:CAMPEP_0170755334 /NCGR_PEP_ID=MMETSP0437-20130122/13462_1 /TAXON_ID=0 /ORGANISM="Sexangularia sp." /LENGTH=1481 /DNA_ID=CAMNT_0011094495 /DNA_START=206 /DNA_END=4651 /DNA_ORIENTATION=+
MQLITSTTVFGTITHLASYRPSGSERDLLLLASPPAKVVAVRLSARTGAIAIVSMHCFEHKGILPSRADLANELLTLSVDPSSAMAAAFVAQQKLVLLPFAQSTVGQGTLSDEAADDARPLLSSQVADLPGHLGVLAFRDAAFLHSYSAPTIAVLHESSPQTWAGRASLIRNSCKVSVLSIEASGGGATRIWPDVVGLPFDLTHVVPVPEPLGGLLVLSPNGAIYLSQQVRFALSFNDAFLVHTEVTRISHVMEAPFVAKVDAPSTGWLRFDRLCVGSSDGSLICIELLTAGGDRVRGLTAHKLGTTVPAATLSVIDSSSIFIGSCVGDSVLLRLRELSEDESNARKAARAARDAAAVAVRRDDEEVSVSDDEESGGAAKRRRRDGAGASSTTAGVGDSAADAAATAAAAASAGADDDEIGMMDDEDAALYGDAPAAGGGTTALSVSKARTGSVVADRTPFRGYKLVVADSLVSTSAIIDMAVCRLPEEEEEEDESDSDSDGSGSGSDASGDEAAEADQGENDEEDEDENENGDDSKPVKRARQDGAGGAAVARTLAEVEDWRLHAGGDVFDGKRPPIVDLVTCGGSGRFGSLVVTHQDIRPAVAMSVPLPKRAIGMWALKVHEEGVTEDPLHHHTFLVLSSSKGTRVLRASDGLSEVSDKVEYYTDGPTLAAVSAFGNSRAVQVFASGIRVLDATGALTQDVEVRHDTTLNPDGATIDSVAAEGDSIVLKLSNGSLVLAAGDQSQRTFSVSTLTLDREGAPDSPVTATALFAVRGCAKPWFVPTKRAAGAPQPSSVDGEGAAAMDEDDEDAMLYGVSSPRSDKAGGAGTSLGVDKQAGEVDESDSATCPLVLFVARGDGSLEAYSVPDGQLLWLGRRFSRGPATQWAGAVDGLKKTKASTNEPLIEELLVTHLGDDTSLRPVLVARMQSGNVMTYRVFGCDVDVPPGQVPLRLARANVSMPVTLSRSFALVPFHDVSGESGFFISGTPATMVFHKRDALVAHTVAGGSVAAFTNFDNVACPSGFVFYQSGALKIASLRTSSTVYGELAWPIRKVPLRCTPHRVVYDDASGMVIVVVSSAFLSSSSGDGNRSVPLTLDKYEIRLYNPQNWEIMDRFALEEHEQVLSILLVPMKHDETRTLRPYLVVGTGYGVSEDEMTKGRVFVFEILMPNMLLRQASVRQEVAAVTALCQCSGYCIGAVGNRLYAYDFSDSLQVAPIAFMEADVYIPTMASIKNWVITGDVMNSVRFIRFRECIEGRYLQPLGKDTARQSVTAVEYLVDEPNLCIVSADTDGTLKTFMYQPDEPDTLNGQVLQRYGTMHLGSRISKMVRVAMTRPLLVPRLRRSATKEQQKVQRKVDDARARLARQGIYAGSFDGSIYLVAPMDELSSIHLRAALTAAVHRVAWPLGLHPMAHRVPPTRLHSARADLSDQHHRSQVVDVDALRYILQANYKVQVEIAKRVGISQHLLVQFVQQCEKAGCI